MRGKTAWERLIIRREETYLGVSHTQSVSHDDDTVDAYKEDKAWFFMNALPREIPPGVRRREILVDQIFAVFQSRSCIRFSIVCSSQHMIMIERSLYDIGLINDESGRLRGIEN